MSVAVSKVVVYLDVCFQTVPDETVMPVIHYSFNRKSCATTGFEGTLFFVFFL